MIASYFEANLDDLYDFEDEDLEVTVIDGDSYRLKPDFEPSVILGQSFGADTTDDSYNQVLAESISAAEEFYGDTPVVAQSEIVECLEENQGYDENSDDLHRVFENSGEAEVVSDYPTTKVLEEAYETVVENGYDPESALFVAHNAHMHRVLTTAEEVGLDGEPFLRDEVEWPENDKQEWVRSPENWARREPLSRAHHWTYFNMPGAKKALDKLGL